jgi:hypothetical protein
MSDVEMRIVINGVDNASPVIKQITDALNGMNASQTSSANQTNSIATATRSASDDATLSLKGLMGEFAQVGAVVTAIAMAAKKTFDFAEEGAQITELENETTNLARLTGSSSQAMTDAVKSATLNTVSDYEAAGMANKIMAADMGLSVTQVGDLATVAMFKSREYGVAVTDVMGNLTKAMIALSPRMLAAYGIIVDQADAEKAYADSLGVSTTSLTRLQKVQAEETAIVSQTNEQIAKTGPLVATQATVLEQFAASQKTQWDQAKQSVADFIEPLIETQNVEALLVKLHKEGQVSDSDYWYTLSRLQWGIADTKKTYNDLMVKENQLETNHNEIMQAGLVAGVGQLETIKSAVNELQAWPDISGTITYSVKVVGLDPNIVTDAIKNIQTLNTQIVLTGEGANEVKPLNAILSAISKTSADTANSLGKEAAPALYNMAIAAGQMTQAGAVKGLEDLGFSSKGATAALKNTKDAAGSLNGVLAEGDIYIITHHIDVYGTGTYAIPGYESQSGGGYGGRGGQPQILGPQGANGLDMDVGSGYPNDRFPFLAQSGEHVKITPAGENSNGATNISLTFPNMTLYGDQKTIEWTLKPAIKNVLREALPNHRIV